MLSYERIPGRTKRSSTGRPQRVLAGHEFELQTVARRVHEGFAPQGPRAFAAQHQQAPLGGVRDGPQQAGTLGHRVRDGRDHQRRVPPAIVTPFTASSTASARRCNNAPSRETRAKSTA
jgi:hypothetical protein